MNDFLSPQNESMIDRLIYQDFQRRLGNDLSEKQKTRLLKTVNHYMKQVAEVIPDAPIQVKNKEVLSAAVPDFISYLNRSASVPSQDEQVDTTRQDVSTRFSQIQNERNQGKAAPPPPPDFRVPLDTDGPSSISIYEQIKKQREEEAARTDDFNDSRTITHKLSTRICFRDGFTLCVPGSSSYVYEGFIGWKSDGTSRNSRSRHKSRGY